MAQGRRKKSKVIMKLLSRDVWNISTNQVAPQISSLYLHFIPMIDPHVQLGNLFARVCHPCKGSGVRFSHEVWDPIVKMMFQWDSIQHGD